MTRGGPFATDSRPPSGHSERSAAARQRAEVYAPRPTGNLLTYAFASGSSLLVACLAVSGFYQIELPVYPLVLAAAVVVAAIAGAIFHLVRSRRHQDAHDREYVREHAAIGSEP